MKIKSIAAFLLFAIQAHAQNTDLPLGNDAYHILDRLEIQTDAETPYFSAHKAITRFDATHYALSIDTVTGGSPNLHSSDRKDIYYIYKENTLSLRATTEECKEDDHNVLSEKPILKTFYITPANLFEANVPHFAMNISPLFDFQVGREIGGTASGRTDFHNLRGLRLQAGIDNKIWFSTNLYESQSRFASNIDREARERINVPGGGFFKNYTSKYLKINDGFDYLNAEAYVGVQASKHIRVQFGHGKNFIGDGYRSMFLSDFGNNYFYLKLNTRIWKFDYQNIFAELTRDAGLRGQDTLRGKKYFAAHHLSFKPIKNLTVGAFETVVFSRNDQFEFQYLNPVIFYRTVEGAIGSSDNALLGVDFKYNFLHSCSLYGQFLLDEFKFSEITSNKGWWGNKYGAQLGLKYIDVANIDHLDAQIEYNMARPYTYAHGTSKTSYTHYNQVLAHPLGANFQEVVGILRYQPLQKLRLQAKIISAQVGRDSVIRDYTGQYNANGISYGSNPSRTYDARPSGYGITLGQGNLSQILTLSFTAAYMLRHNLYLELNAYRRQETNPFTYYNSTVNYVGVGVRYNVGSKVVDY
jgi:Capsule assembly protein Wzi